MIRKDYNNVDWSIHFYLDETSPSGLRWNRKVLTGNGYNSCRYNVGDKAGSKRYSKNGKPKCWDVSCDLIDYKVHRIIWHMLHASIDSKLVIDHLDGNPFNNTHNNLRLVTTKTNLENSGFKTTSSTGVVGVRYSLNGSGTPYYSARWQSKDGVSLSKSFSVAKYGMSEAFRLACEYRTAQIALLNENGANYTLRHGSA